MAEKTAVQLVFKGLLKHMRPVQALVFMALYQQFPERFIARNDYFFTPSIRPILKTMSIKPPVYYLMLTRLVEGGWLQKRPAKRGGLEYRIVFEKLEPFIRTPVDTAT